ncbi:GOLPH3/VPS74 family protein [Streptomyces solaniscabiei]|uniref:GOLPH3/VPS74 family protein n=1 Tax=Streptomyces solaniscabiei TaxID=2683255 RepID=UPI001CE2F14E|nr:GPP34 family phosphoprotein [Streptomyces solaniscabiei]
MTTPMDLLIVAREVATDRPVEEGDLSLALAGAELLDLVDAGAVTLDGDRIVPGPRRGMEDHLLDAAESSLDRQAPYESVEDWLWRRGRGLFGAYRAALETEGQPTRQRHGLLHRRSGPAASADSPARRHAAERWTSGEPVLAGLASALGIHDEPAGAFDGPGADTLETVLAAVGGAVTELAGVRQQRQIEEAAFDNIWRAP